MKTKQPDEYDDPDEAADRSNRAAANRDRIGISVLESTHVKNLTGICAAAPKAIERVAGEHEQSKNSGCAGHEGGPRWPIRRGPDEVATDDGQKQREPAIWPQPQVP
jgi:hypothetical protein